MLPEATVEGMQESCVERQYSTTGSSVDTIIKTEPTWTPEDFLQSTLEEGGGVICTAGGGEPPIAAKPRGRRKQQWKLKFHHQALPPEYLDHYEASLSKAQTMAQSKSKQSPPAVQDISNKTPPPLLATLPEESVHSWLQRITSIQNEIQKFNTNSPLQQVSTQQPTRKRRTNAVANNTPTSNKVVNYRDLPYMGEMTLNNSKPRRGRKPKKADICHLIYKNYGTIFPGTPSHLVDERLNMAAPQISLDSLPAIKQENFTGTPFKQRTDIQNKIISSLLEKRLSQENKKARDTKSKKSKSVHLSEEHALSKINKQIVMPPTSPMESEPLNLCVRDLNNLKIRLLRKHGNVYAKADEENKIKIECEDPLHDEDMEKLGDPGSALSKSPILKMDALDFNKALQNANLSTDNFKKPDTEIENQIPGGYVYWPNAGVFLHPLALQSQLMYYQGLTGGNPPTAPTDRGSPNESTGSIKSERQTPVLENETQPSPGGSSESSTSTIRSKNSLSKPERSPGRAPAKRKRSAIFIPPVPGDSSTSPATEVSICKFKFTGGAKPSLQEKKMLSVDSGGNFRYYSGTGDKANRGYEFFPRESLQPPTSTAMPITPAVTQAAPATPVSQPKEDATRKKRKSRKSLQREKLEQTFKEKGFLIQTQQLESAEGATYCKFRQLRKFTRYLFRSWKDYLPGAIQNEGENPVPALTAPEAGTSSPVATDWS